MEIRLDEEEKNAGIDAGQIGQRKSEVAAGAEDVMKGGDLHQH